MIPTSQKRLPKKRFIGHFWLSLLREQESLSIIAMTLLLTPLVLVPVTSRRWHGAQTIGMELGAVVLLVTLLSRPWSKASLKWFFVTLSIFPLLCLHLFLLLALVSAVSSDTSAFAIQGILPLAAGILITDVVAIQSRVTGHCLFIIDALLGTGLLIALLGIALYGSSGTTVAVGVFRDHQLFGAFLMLIIPFSISLSLAPVAPARKIVAQAASVVCLVALLISRCRSAWIGEAIALLTFCFLFVFAELQISKPQPFFLKQHLTFVYAIGTFIAIIGFSVVFVGLSPDRAATFARVHTVANVLQDKDASTQWRLNVWAGTKSMIAEKPLLGRGIGSYPLRHFPFTKTGHPTSVVQGQGPSIEDEAHNSYLQIAADLGMIGLGLWLITFGSLIVSSILMVRCLASNRFRQRLLIGCIAAIVGQMVDALANPGWQFGCVTLYLWIIFGLTISSLRQYPSKLPALSPEVARVFPWPQRVVFILTSLGVGYGLLWLILKTAFALPAPHL